MPLITVFTPTFNRSNKLHRVFESLQKQTFRDFEWIIVDDGSTDNTAEVIQHYKKLHNDFDIIYHRQQKAGKHIAVNLGVALAKGYFFQIADSDDAIEPNGLQDLLNAWQSIPEERKQLYCGIWACCKDQFGNRVSDYLRVKSYEGNLKELFYKYDFRKEAFQLYLTSVMKEFPFPDLFKNVYFPEGVIWRKMTDKYLIKVIDKELRVYYLENTGDSIISAKIPARARAITRCLESSEFLNNDLQWFFYYKSYFLKMALVYASFRPFLSKSHKQVLALNSNAFILYMPFIIPGLIINLMFRIKDMFRSAKNKIIKRMFRKILTFLHVVSESKKPGRFLLAQVLAKTKLCKFFIIKMNGYKLYFTPSSLSITLFSNPGDRDEEELFLKKLLREGDVYVDVGANIGTLALCASQLVGINGKVIAIEAHPKTFGYLSNNAALNDFTNMTLMNYAVGDKEGTLYFSDINSDDQNKVVTAVEGGLKVPVKKLDVLLRQHNHISLLKIDVEGFEKFVIEGAFEILKRTEFVLFESWDQHFKGYGYTTGDLIALLEINGFNVYNIEGAEPVNVSASYSSGTCENLLAVKDIDAFMQKIG